MGKKISKGIPSVGLCPEDINLSLKILISYNHNYGI